MQSTKESYDAMAFYEKHVDQLQYALEDEQYPDFNFDTARGHCCTNSSELNMPRGRGVWKPAYSELKFKEMVAYFFGTTVKEMDEHWRHFK